MFTMFLSLSGSSYLFKDRLVVLLQLLELPVQCFQPLLPDKKSFKAGLPLHVLGSRKSIPSLEDSIQIAQLES